MFSVWFVCIFLFCFVLLSFRIRTNTDVRACSTFMFVCVRVQHIRTAAAKPLPFLCNKRLVSTLCVWDFSQKYRWKYFQSVTDFGYIKTYCILRARARTFNTWEREFFSFFGFLQFLLQFILIIFNSLPISVGVATSFCSVAFSWLLLVSENRSLLLLSLSRK